MDESVVLYVVVVQLPSHVRLFVTPWAAAARPPCLSPSPRVCPSSCSLHLRCRPAISSSDARFSCPQSFPAFPGGYICCLAASVVSNSVRPYGLQPSRLLCPGDSLVKKTSVSCHTLLQGIFPAQGSNPGLLHCRPILYR